MCEFFIKKAKNPHLNQGDFKANEFKVCLYSKNALRAL